MNYRLKQIAATTLTASLVWMPPQQTKAMPLMLGICIGAAAAAAVAGVAIVVKNCHTRYYCLWDYDNELKFVKQTTKKAATLEGYGILLGPYETAREAGDACVTNNIIVPNRLTSYPDPMFFIERSTNLVNWTVAANLTGQDPEDFEWRETNTLGRCYYRVKLVESK